MAVNLEKTAPPAGPQQFTDSDRLQYLVNNDEDGELAAELVGSSYLTWCYEIDAAITRFLSPEEDDDTCGCDYCSCDDYDQDEYEYASDTSDTVNSFDMLVGACLIGVIADALVSCFSAVYATPVALACMAIYIFKAWRRNWV